MPMIAILVLPVIMAAAPAPEPSPATAVKPVCQNVNRSFALDREKPLRPHNLTAEPPARQILTVLRTVDGCSKPVVIREDVGAPARR